MLLQRFGITIRGVCENAGGGARSADIDITGPTDAHQQSIRTGAGTVSPGSGALDTSPPPQVLTGTGVPSTNTLSAMVQGWAWTPSQAIEFGATGGINMQGDGCVFALSATRS